jgi:hypothetical protein
MSELLSATDYRDFIARSLQASGKGTRRLSSAEFARRAGFSSRSYPADVIKGYRRITPATLPQFIKGMKLRGALKSYFTLLVARDEDDINVEHLAAAEITRRLERLRERIAEAGQPADAIPARFYEQRGWLEVFASLGTYEEGASLAEIVARTGFTQSECERILAGMVAGGAAHTDAQGTRYRACSCHVVFEKLGVEKAFQKHFLESLNQARHVARGNGFRSPENFFCSSVFSVKKHRVLELKNRLRELMIEFADTHEDATGDGIAKLCVSLQVPGACEIK